RTWFLFVCVSLFVSAALVRPNLFLQGEAHARQNRPERGERSAQQRQQTQRRAEPAQSSAAIESDDGEDPDLPAFANGKINKENYLKGRDDQVTLIRGLNEVMQKSGNLRAAAIEHMERARVNSPSLGPAWVQIGPAPIPNGQTQSVTTAVSGRTT